MLVRTLSAVMHGLQPIQIEVEVEATIGTPQFVIIGLPTREIDEAKERITAALINCGVPIRARRTVVNLAPADVRKTGSGLELAIAVGLAMQFRETRNDSSRERTLQNVDENRQTPSDLLGYSMLFGELSLDGRVKPIRGALPLVLAARQLGYTTAVIPEGNASEVAVLSGITVLPVSHLTEVLNWLACVEHIKPLATVPYTSLKAVEPAVDFMDIVGQTYAKRALEVAAAGGHNLLLVGPPGAGKSLLAQSLAGILPPLSETEATELTAIYSVAGLLCEQNTFVTERPFRAPHHSTSLAGLTGGGIPVLPGEISLAHHGVLFLDEVPEFSKTCLESLRQPLEEKQIIITRASGSFHFPARFSLVAAANPCPCGFLGSKHKACRCSRSQQRSYAARLSGPLLDRIDMTIWISELAPQQLRQLHQIRPSHSHEQVAMSESSAIVRDRVTRARQRQIFRSAELKLAAHCNADLTAKQLKQLSGITKEAQQLLVTASQRLHLSARSFSRVLKVARTIADLRLELKADAYEIAAGDIAEALQYRAVSWGSSVC